ncbi:MAG: hypothetical protein M0004_16215 [Actinomycetota bacterium]|nr:hypothetical protein [Actinomycetota bacterium]
MPYRYSAAEARQGASAAAVSATPGERRRPARALGMLAGVVVFGGAATGIVATLGGPSGVAAGPVARAVQRAFVAANVLEQNLGASAPAAASATVEGRFVLVSHPRSVHPAVPAALTPAQAERLLAGQRSAIGAVFDGGQAVTEQRALRRLVAGELGPGGVPVGSGGASVHRWLSVSVAGRTARAEALVDRWELRVARGADSGHLVTTWAHEEIDALAHLVRTGSGWRVVALAEAPWQEPT